MFFLFALLSLTLQAQYKGVTTLNVKVAVAEDVEYVNVYMADKYFHFADDAEPVCRLPLSAGSIHYEVVLDRLTAFRFRSVDASGKEDGNMHSIPVVPGQTYNLIAAEDLLGFMGGEANPSPQINERAFHAFREETKWKSPHLPKIKGEVWSMPDCEYGDFQRMYVREVYLNKKETVLRLYHKATMGVLDLLEPDDYLTDEAGNKYKVLRPILGDLGDSYDMEAGVYGAYYAFEPLPKGCKSFTLNARHHYPVTVRPAAKAQKPNFSVTITATPGIADTGWLLKLHENLQKYSTGHLIADLTADQNRQVTYAFYLDKPRMLDIVATFGDGSICDYYMAIPAVPGSHADVTVKNGVFEWTGSGFYKDVDNADAYVENVKRWSTEEEYTPLIHHYLVNHAAEQGCLYYYYSNKLWDVEEMAAVLPDSILASPFGKLIADDAKNAEKQRKLEAERQKNAGINDDERIIIGSDASGSDQSSPWLLLTERRKPDYKPDVEALREGVVVGNAVDLGLSVKWADMNVGATKPEEPGTYYTWGDVETPVRERTGWVSYKWCKGAREQLTKYSTDEKFGMKDDLTKLLPEDDAASLLWQGGWRMPTKAEAEELVEKCTWTWCERNGMKGYKVTGPNGGSIFLSASGCLNWLGLYGVGEVGYFWTSELNPEAPADVYYLGLHEDKYSVGFMDRFAGRPVRAVCP